MNEQVLANMSAIDLLSGRVKKLENSAGGGGSSMNTYKIEVNVKRVSSSSATITGFTVSDNVPLYTIEQALRDDPEHTTVIFNIVHTEAAYSIMAINPPMEFRVAESYGHIMPRVLGAFEDNGGDNYGFDISFTLSNTGMGSVRKYSDAEF